MGVMIKKWYICFIYRIVQSADKSAISQQIFFFELIKARYSFAFSLWSLKQTKAFCSLPLVFLFPFLLVCIMLDFFHTKQNASIFLSSGVEPVTLCHGAQDTELWSRGRNSRRTKECLWTWGPPWTALDPTKEGCCTLHRTPVWSQADFQF